jgi:hypothetical protein
MTVLDQNLEPISLRVDEFGRLKVVGTGGGGGGVSDHGDLTGLADDDHPQYLNNVRGDARYAGIAHTHLASEISNSTAAGRALLTAADAPAQRTALGLGTAATTAATAYATAAQGATADAALKPANNLSDVANAGTARTNLGAAASGAIGSSGLTMATARLLGRSTAGTGALEEITLGTNLSFSGTTLNAAGGGGSPGGSDTQVQFNDGGAFAGASGWTWNKTTNTMTLASGTQTISNPAQVVTQTWNASGVTFTGWRLNVTDTASAAASLLAEWQVNGTVVASVSKAGMLSCRAGSYNNPGLRFGTSGSDGLYWQSGLSVLVAGNVPLSVGSTVTVSGVNFGLSAGGVGVPDVVFARDAANTLAQRNGTAAQESRTYGTFTDASNYRRLSKGMSTAGVAFLRPEGAGTGASGNVLHISGLPTSNPGPGILWNDAGTVKVGT